MVGYGRLCSRLWDALMSFGAKSNFIPEETAAALDMKTQEWLESIPSDLQLRHPRLGLAARAQPRVLQRLRALLYLRGNHTRILIYRHHMLSPSRIKADMTSARLVVEIARDSIQVLIHLNTTSDIYSRQQSAFNYFLISALAIIFLAVCHDAATFAETCRPSFHAAVDLVRDFSRRSQASRRLWKSIRGLLPRLRKLTNGRLEEGREGEQNNSTQQETAGLTAANANPSVDDSLYREAPLSGLAFGHQANEQNASHVNMDSNTEVSGSTPNMFEVGNSLVELFDVFESAPQFPSDYSGQDYYGAMFPLDSMYGESGELSRRFQGLI
jgi:hypothetical protein